MILPYHVYTTGDRSRVVEETDPDVGVLLYAAGEDIPDAEVKRLGLDKPKAKTKAEAALVPETLAEAESPTESKAVHADAAEDKAVEGPKRAPRG